MSEVDNFIGRKFGCDGQLEVLPWRGKRRKRYLSGNTIKTGAKIYHVKCSVCEKDPELYGEGIFESPRTPLLNGSIPCGCSKRPLYSTEQYKVLLKRRSDIKSFEVVSMPSTLNLKSLVDVRCSLHGYCWTTCLEYLLEGSSTCFNCKISGKIQNSRIDTNVLQERFISSKLYPPGAEFTRYDNDDSKWYYKCPACSSDEMFSAGLCTGIFETQTHSLSAGNIPCRCCKTHRLSKTQIEYKIKQEIETSDKKYTFIGWVENYINLKSKFKLCCPEGHKWEASVGNFIHSKSGCPTCCNYGFDKNKQGYLYILKITGEELKFTGFGITNFPEKRIPTHKNTLDRYKCSVVDFSIFKAGGDSVMALEQYFLKNFEIYGTCIKGFKKESTLYSNYESLVKLAHNTEGFTIYEQ